MAGNTSNQLVATENVTVRSDLRMFVSDNNATISE
jgi:hypothetical protein